MYATDTHQVKLKEQIKELFFKSGDNIFRPVRQELNKVYPLSKRMPNLLTYDQAVEKEHDQRFNQARNILYEQRNLVRRLHLERYTIRITPMPDTSEASIEMRSLVCDNALDRVYEMLVAYLPILVPSDNAKSVMEVVRGIYEYEYKNLHQALLRYAASFAPGIISHEKDFE